MMSNKEESTYQNLLRDYVYFLLEDAHEAKAKRDKARGTPDESFYTGSLLGFHRSISLLQQYVESFGIPLEEIGLDKIVPDKDFV
ncbi:MAG: hypothetical protein AB1414_20545 [bacterium]